MLTCSSDAERMRVHPGRVEAPSRGSQGGMRAEEDARSGGWGHHAPAGAQGCCCCDSRRLEGCPFNPTNGADLTRSLKRNIHLKTLMLRRGSLERGKECPPVVARQLERLS